MTLDEDAGDVVQAPLPGRRRQREAAVVGPDPALDVGAHVRGHNYQSVGVCLVGGLDDDGEPADNFTAAQFSSLRNVIAMLASAWPGADVLGHRDLSPDLDGDGIISSDEWLKDCPCFDVKQWLVTYEST